MNTDLLAFYNTIFNVQITSFSIIIPILFVFIQLTNKEHSTYNIKKLVKDPRIVSYFIIALFIIIISGFSSYFLTIKKYNFIKSIDFNSLQIISSNMFSLIVFVLFLISFIPIISFIFFLIKQINPGIFIKNYFNNINFKKVEIYLYKNHGLPLVDYTYLSKSKRFYSVGPDEQNEITKYHEKEFEKLKLKHLNDIKRNESIEIIINEEYENIFGVVINILSYNMNNVFIIDFNDALISFIDSYFKLNQKLKKSHDKTLVEKLLLEYLSILERLFNSAVNINYRSFLVELIDSLEKIMHYHGKNKEYDLCADTYKLLENFIDSCNTKHRIEAINILHLFNKYSEEYSNQDTNEDAIDNIIRTFSRVSEKIIIKYDIEKQPIMVTTDNENVYNNIFETLYKYFEYFAKYRIKKYPSDLLNANYFVFKCLIEKMINSNSELLANYLNEQMYSFFYEPEKLCIKFIEVNNIDSACLSIMSICELYALFISNDLKDYVQKNIESIIFLGFYISSQDCKFECEFMHEGAVEYIYNKLVHYKTYLHSINNIVMEIFIKSHSNNINIRKAEKFLFDLGILFHSNFGLNFNWSERNWFEKKDTV